MNTSKYPGQLGTVDSPENCGRAVEALLEDVSRLNVRPESAANMIDEVLLEHLGEDWFLPDTTYKRIQAWIMSEWSPTDDARTSVLLSQVHATEMPKVWTLLERDYASLSRENQQKVDALEADRDDPSWRRLRLNLKAHRLLVRLQHFEQNEASEVVSVVREMRDSVIFVEIENTGAPYGMRISYSIPDELQRRELAERLRKELKGLELFEEVKREGLDLADDYLFPYKPIGE